MRLRLFALLAAALAAPAAHEEQPHSSLTPLRAAIAEVATAVANSSSRLLRSPAEQRPAETHSSNLSHHGESRRFTHIVKQRVAADDEPEPAHGGPEHEDPKQAVQGQQGGEGGGEDSMAESESEVLQHAQRDPLAALQLGSCRAPARLLPLPIPPPLPLQELAFAVFVFPICAVVLGLAISWLLNRYAPAVPYTPVLLVVGFTVACLQAPKLFAHTHLAPSLEAWQHLSGHLILYVFIPPLIFGDAMQLDFHILKRCAGQCLLLAVPAVMFSTALTAVVAHYLLPYHWSWTLAIAFGAVLSATDPVAVVSLLKSLGASPALTMLIGGESLLNDGTAMVRYLVITP